MNFQLTRTFILQYTVVHHEKLRLFLTGSYDASLRIWNQGGKCLGTFTDHAAAIKCVAIVNAEGERIMNNRA